MTIPDSVTHGTPKTGTPMGGPVTKSEYTVPAHDLATFIKLARWARDPQLDEIEFEDGSVLTKTDLDELLVRYTPVI